MVIGHYLEDDGQISFFLEPTKELMALLPRDIAEKAKDPETETSVEFYVDFDCATFDLIFLADIHGMDGVHTDDIASLRLDFSGQTMKESTAIEINNWCENSLGKDLVDLANDYLWDCDQKLSVKDFMFRMFNTGFGRPVFSARSLGCAADYGEGFGDAIAMTYDSKLPKVMAQACGVLNENCIEEIFVDRIRVRVGAAIAGDDQDFTSSLSKIDRDEYKDMRMSAEDIQRYSARLILNTQTRYLNIMIKGIDSDEAAYANVPLKEMAEIAGEKIKDRQQAENRLKM